MSKPKSKEESIFADWGKISGIAPPSKEALEMLWSDDTGVFSSDASLSSSLEVVTSERDQLELELIEIKAQIHRSLIKYRGQREDINALNESLEKLVDICENLREGDEEKILPRVQAYVRRMKAVFDRFEETFPGEEVYIM